MNEQTRTPEAVNGLTSEQLREKLQLDAGGIAAAAEEMKA